MQQVVVVGGANVDVVARSTDRFTAGTSNPGRAHSSPGGVGRNIAANLGHLGVPTSLIAAFGTDTFGSRLRAETQTTTVDLGFSVTTTLPTGSYLAMLDTDGELVGAVSDMAAAESLRPEHVPADAVIGRSFVVVDGNVPVAVLAHVCRLAASHQVPVVIDPVSDPKAGRLRGVLDGTPVHTITPTRSELATLSGRNGVEEGVAALRAAGVERVWVREGACGSTLFGPSGTIAVPAIPASVRDVTGAGDAMTAAYVHALLMGYDDPTAVRYGAAAAYLTISSDHTVRPDLRPELIEEVMKEQR